MGWWIGSVASSLGNLQYHRGKAQVSLPMSSNALQMMGVAPIAVGNNNHRSVKGTGNKNFNHNAGISRRRGSATGGRGVVGGGGMASPPVGRNPSMLRRGSNFGVVHGSVPGE